MAVGKCSNLVIRKSVNSDQYVNPCRESSGDIFFCYSFSRLFYRHN